MGSKANTILARGGFLERASGRMGWAADVGWAGC